jgi:hypothetical protein
MASPPRHQETVEAAEDVIIGNSDALENNVKQASCN